LAAPPTGMPPGHKATKAGRFWFSEPMPQVNHEPKLGRTSRWSPVFMSISDNSWLGSSTCIDRITASSSAHRDRCGNKSLIGIPL
jgi:hypothetical protein